jgi:hypothetical protein
MTIARNADGRLEQFAVNTNLPTSQSNVFHRWQTTPGGQWSSWQRMPGYLTAISASATADGRLELFGVNTRVPATENNNVFHRWQTTPGGSWTAWEHLGGYLTSLTAGTNADGRLEVFGINANLPTSQNNIFQRSQTPTGSWTGWQRVPGYLTSVSLAANSDGRLELVGANTTVRTSLSNVLRRRQVTPGGNWTDWMREVVPVSVEVVVAVPA